MVKLKLSKVSSPMRSHHNIYITSHDFDSKSRKKNDNDDDYKHHQQIKVIKHHDGYFPRSEDVPSCRV